MRKVTIYSLIDPRDNMVKYIGKTVQSDPSKRYDGHIYQWKRDKGRHTKVNSWVKCLYNLGLKPLFNVVDTCNESNWKAYERGYIALLKACGANLKNLTNGGDEQPSNSNSPEAKAKRLETLKTSEAWKAWHKPHAEKMKKYYTEGRLKIGLNNLSKKRKEEAVRKISENSAYSKNITLKDKITNTVLNFSSLTAFATYLGYKSPNSIKDFVFNKRNTHLHGKYEIIEIKN